jgi:quinol monooxygenase YgiN
VHLPFQAGSVLSFYTHNLLTTRATPFEEFIMLAILAKIVLDPHSVAAYLKAAEPILPATRLESGCTHYAFARCVEHDNVIWITEEWDSEQALQDHLKSPHITTFLQQISNLGVKSVEVRKYTVSAVGGL